MHKSVDEFEVWPDATTGFCLSVGRATDRFTVGKKASSRFLEPF